MRSFGPLFHASSDGSRSSGGGTADGVMRRPSVALPDVVPGASEADLFFARFFKQDGLESISNLNHQLLSLFRSREGRCYLLWSTSPYICNSDVCEATYCCAQVRLFLCFSSIFCVVSYDAVLFHLFRLLGYRTQKFHFPDVTGPSKSLRRV